MYRVRIDKIFSYLVGINLFDGNFWLNLNIESHGLGTIDIIT